MGANLTEAENLQRSLQSQYELDLVAEAYASIRRELTAEAQTATTAEKAWGFILELRGLDRVLQRLKTHIHTAKFDLQGKN